MEKNIKQKILIIDDNPSTINMLSILFEAEGYEVAVAIGGEKGIKIAEISQPDIILLDILMPGIDGYQTCAELKKNERTRDIPIIFMSALTQTFDKVRAFKSGAVDYFTKPIQIEEVLARITTHLSVNWLRKELHAANKNLEEKVQSRTAELLEANKELEEKIQEQKRLIAAVEQLNEALAITDRSGYIQYVNDSFKRILPPNLTPLPPFPEGKGGECEYSLQGMARGECELKVTPSLQGRGRGLGHVLKDMFEDSTACEAMREAVEHGAPWTGHLTCRENGEAFYEGKIMLSPVSLAPGQITNYAVIIQNITREARIERQLRQAEKMESIGTLAAGIAHDFNNILGSILLNTEYVIRNIRGTEDETILGYVLSAANRAKDLVKQILTFSRRSKRERKSVQIQPIFKETLSLLQATLPKTIDFRYSISTDDRPVVIDPTEFHQVLINLFSNAVHAIGTHSGLIEISIRDAVRNDIIGEIYRDLSAESFLKITVRDTGEGILPEHIDRIFDPFFTTKAAAEGTGMGLAVVHSIITEWNGAITLHSTPGEGTIFEIYIPKEQVNISDQIETEAHSYIGNENILFADDEMVLVCAAERALNNSGYKVKAAGNVEQAIRIFQSESELFDLIIADLTIAARHDCSFLKEIRKLRPDIPIILCTGYDEPFARNQIRDFRIEEILIKPVAWSDMTRIVRQVLDRTLKKEKLR